MKKNLPRWRQLPAEKLSSRVLYVIIALVCLLFALFWLVGYDRPYEDAPNFSAPLFTDVVIVFMEVLVLATACCAVWSLVRGLKIRGKGEKQENNVPTKKIGYSVTIGTVLLLLLTFLLGSSDRMSVNGVPYAHVFWLKVADMLISSSLVLMVVAVGAMIFGATKYVRREHVHQA